MSSLEPGENPKNMIVNGKEFRNCLITIMNDSLKINDFPRPFYSILHKLSNRILHAISISEAYKIAGLMDADYKVANFIKELEEV